MVASRFSFTEQIPSESQQRVIAPFLTAQIVTRRPNLSQSRVTCNLASFGVSALAGPYWRTGCDRPLSST